MSILMEISSNIQSGDNIKVAELVQKAIDDGLNVKEILDEGLLAGMNVIGYKFKNDEVFVPDVIKAARAMNAGSEILKQLLVAEGVKPIGKVILGSVKGDLHDIGKKLVKMMMESKSIEVIDLGISVPCEDFIKTAKEEKAKIIAMSSLLTTTMHEMKKVVDLAKEEGLRDSVTIMIGGAPVTDDFCKIIGADIYAPDAATAADDAEKVLKR